ncbi:MAG: tetratricopeptide repeat protein [Planctomycetota bacterium]
MADPNNKTRTTAAPRRSARKVPRAARDYSRWRAGTLAMVYVLMALHIAHWKLAGKTLAPLELNEVMYTLELGIVTAGFLFMVVAVLATALFGRFFCSWGCHILALQDLCAWLLAKMRIRPKPVRSRVLLLVPPLAMFYMFLWPQVSLLVSGGALPQLHMRTDAQGWASFLTTNFWRNLPGPWITIITFAICGFAIVYVLGSRGFCTYACPYGAAFALADRFAPGRIKAVGDCSKCGICTAVCQSRVRVHEEVARFGRVVNPSCLKDLDCVTVCPNGALAYGLSRPAIMEGIRPIAKGGLPYDFTWPEDTLIGLMTVVSLLVFRGLYRAVPFLMTLAIGGILGYLVVVALRMFQRPTVRINNFQLTTDGRLTRSGIVFSLVGSLLAGFTVHSGFIRFHEWRGDRLFSQVAADGAEPLKGNDRVVAEQALASFGFCDNWGLFHPPELLRRTAWLNRRCGNSARASQYLERAITADPANSLILCDWARNQTDKGEAAANKGDSVLAHSYFAEAVRCHPENATYHYNLAVILGVMGRRDEAAAEYRLTLQLNPNDVESHNNLAFIMLDRGDIESARPLLVRALELNPNYAPAHFNLGRVYHAMGRWGDARRSLETARRTDPNYTPYVNELLASEPRDVRPTLP